MSDLNPTSFSLEELSNESGFDTRVIRSFIEQGLMRGPTSLGRYARYSRQHLERLQAIKVLKEKEGLRLSEVRQRLLLMSDAEIAALAESGSTTSASGSALDYILSQGQQFDTGLGASLEPPPPTEGEGLNCVPGANLVRGSNQSERGGARLSIANAIAARLGLGMKNNFSNMQGAGGDSDDGLSDRRGQSSAEHPTNVIGFKPDAAPDVVSHESGLTDLGAEQSITKDRLATPVDRLIVGLKQQLGSKPVRKQSKKEVWHRIQITPDIELSVRGIQDEQHLARLERVADYLRELLTGGGYE
jgi:DNA-binding transcriptional MerR regulator